MTLNFSFPPKPVRLWYVDALRPFYIFLLILATALAARTLTAQDQDHGQLPALPSRRALRLEPPPPYFFQSRNGRRCHAQRHLRPLVSDRQRSPLPDASYPAPPPPGAKRPAAGVLGAARGRIRRSRGQSLGSASAAVGAGMYPAKYSFDSNTLNCAGASEPNYVVYNTSVTPSATQASVVAFTTSTRSAHLRFRRSTGLTTQAEPYRPRSFFLRMAIRLPLCSRTRAKRAS